MDVITDLTVVSLDKLLKLKEQEILSLRGTPYVDLYSRLWGMFPRMGMWTVDRLTTVVRVYWEVIDAGCGVTRDDARRAVLLFYGTATKLPFGPFLHFSLRAAKFFRQAREEGMPESFYEQLYSESGLRRLDAAYGVWEVELIDRNKLIPIRHTINYLWLKKYLSKRPDFRGKFPPLHVIKRFDKRSLLAYLYFYKYFKDDTQALDRMVENLVSSHASESLDEWADCLKAMTELYDAVLSGVAS